MTRALSCALALLLTLPCTARAHATLLRSTPASGARLAVAPRLVTLTFNEPLDAGMSEVTLESAGGVHLRLAAAADPHDVNVLVATLPDSLRADAYRVAYRVVSADGHPVRGTIAFAVVTSAGAPAPAFAEPASDPQDVAWGPSVAGAPAVPALLRGVAAAALMALAGLLLLAVTSGPTIRLPRLVTVLAVATPLLLALHLGAWLLHVSPDHRLTGEGVGAALHSAGGRLEAWRLGAALLVPWALFLARRPRLAFAFAMVALLLGAGIGHAAALHPRWAIGAKAVHLLAAAAWLGGLLWLGTRVRAADLQLREAHRVSATALGAVIAVTASGALQAALFMTSPVDLVRQPYGWLVLAKVAGLVVLLGFGAHHRLRAIPALGTGGTGRFAVTLRREVLVMLLVVLAGGLLAYVPPHAAATSATVIVP